MPPNLAVARTGVPVNQPLWQALFAMEETDSFWCIVANVKREIPYGPQAIETKSGLRKFKAGARVQIVGAFYGPAENIVVIGQHRKSGKFISCIIKANAVENLRIKLIYSPQVIEFLKDFKPNGAHMTTTEERALELMENIPEWANRMNKQESSQ